LRRFELLLIFAEVFAVAWAAIFGVRTRRGIAGGVLLAAFVAHWQIEGLRWQMIPVYLAALGLAVGDILSVERRLDWPRRISRGLFGLSGLALGAILPLALPVPELPVPPGPEPIGTVSLEIVDTEREETYGPPGPGRRLMAQVWYPALATAGGSEPIPWSGDWDVVAPAVSNLMGFPGWFLSHTGYTQSHASSSASVATGTFPVVVYSHGWTGFRTNAVYQIESLVSSGFIVVAIDHTYLAVTTRFPDNEVVPYNPDALPDITEVGEEAYVEATADLVGVFTDDITTVVNALEAGPNGPFGELASSFDTTRLGVYGNEAGGGAAIAFCLEDERCDAAMGLDPWVEPIPDQTLAISATRPSLYMRSDDWRGTDNDAILRGIAERSTSTTHWIGVDGTAETDFLNMPLVSPIAARLGWKGLIPAGRVIPIVDRYLLGFFEVNLIGTGAAAIDSPSSEEVSLEVIRPE
jgi:acetyl esterase/lipase